LVDLGPGVAVEAAWALDRGSSPDGPFPELAENLLSLSEGSLGSVVVTSPESGVGRTSVCLGLGAALAGGAEGRRVAVLDCNLDRPHLHRLFDKPNFTGLTNAISNGRSPGGYGFEVAPGLLVVPTGPLLPDAVAGMKSDGLVEAVRSMREDADIVLLDGPVASEVLDSPVLSRGFDGVLLVIHATRTPKSDARGATDDLLDAGVNLLGIVLNGSV
jgi:Mrp family chromosome partitioning ATPase